MCGIFVYKGKIYKLNQLLNSIKSIKHRGPDDTVVEYVGSSDELIFGFHRLAIMDPTPAGSQPMKFGDCTYVCNGEIYNWKDLAKKYNFELKSKCDCEIIYHLYKKFGFDMMIDMLDGYFAIVLYDESTKMLYVGRDLVGVRPLFVGHDKINNEYYFTSEMKAISTLEKENNIYIEVNQFPPASIGKLDLSDAKSELEINKYFEFTPYTDETKHLFHTNLEDIKKKICELLVEAVAKRINADRPIGSLLSGGLDSSLIAALACKFLKTRYSKSSPKYWDGKTSTLDISFISEKQLPFKNQYYSGEDKDNVPNTTEESSEEFKFRTFSIGMSGSPDLAFAKIVMKHIESDHHQSLRSDSDMLSAVKTVIYMIESYDVTTVRASIANWILCMDIRDSCYDSCKVLFNGDGSDELFCGYKYFSKCSSPYELHKENIKLMSNIHYFDVLRSDRSISTNGIESRVPFLDKNLIKYCMMIDPQLKMSNTTQEKKILRDSFKDTNILPHNVLYRDKEAFSDGVSHENRSWHMTIKNYIDTQVTDREFMENKDKYVLNTPMTKEAYFYRKIFEELFPGHANVIPYFWMPNWSNVNDPSARELKK